MILYYENGLISDEGNYFKDVPIGEFLTYFSNGISIKSIVYFDSLGRKIDLKVFKESGERDFFDYPLISTLKDTVNVGDTILFYIKIANSDTIKYKKGHVLVSSLFDETGTPQDTLDYQTFNNLEGYWHSLIAYKKGVNSFNAEIMFPISTDSGEVAKIFRVTYPYFVFTDSNR